MHVVLSSCQVNLQPIHLRLILSAGYVEKVRSGRCDMWYRRSRSRCRRSPLTILLDMLEFDAFKRW
jgi:hypothetical protein